MRKSLAEFDVWWMGMENVDFGLLKDEMGGRLQRLIELAPRCLLVSSSEEQSRLLSLFDKYAANTGFWKLKNRKLSKEIEQIIRIRPDAKFISENHNSVRNGIKFWTAFGDVLRVFSDKRQNELRKATSDVRLLEERLSNMRKSLAEFDVWWMGMENVDFGLLKDEMGGRLQRLIELAPRCLLVSSSEEQSKLASLFYEYQTGLRSLKENEHNMSGEITQILRTEASLKFVLENRKRVEVISFANLTLLAKINLVSENRKRVENGEKLWNILSDLLDYFDNDKQKEIHGMVDDAESLSLYLLKMRDALDEFDTIQEFDKKKTEYGNHMFSLLNHAKSRFGSSDGWADKIRQEIYAYWLDAIERHSPILRGDPISNYYDKRDDLKRLLEVKRAAVKEKIRHDIEGAIDPSDMYGWGRTEEQKKWRRFAAELRKKRRVKPVRKMFEQYADHMFKIAPCWLASPESVSKIFPLERNMFDLVIVDEASQLAVERAIPFLYRAKHAVIAGDEKQLPPFDLFQVRGDEPDVDDTDDIPEEKSLLDLARVRFRTFNLKWHYRSKYQELINFSNHAFYRGLLNVAPNAAANPQYPPIRWIKCDGVWENQTNHVEAERVVDEVKSIWSGHAGDLPSIGIITFNDKQRTLILDMVEERLDSDAEFSELHGAAHHKKGKDDHLFVKNIENVQGDERDVIIFSIGYASNTNGKFLNIFGLLSRKGGENRLNVAITRARKQMVVVSSIEPSDIRSTKNDGPRMLARFLEYAKMTDSRNLEGMNAVLSEINPDMERSRDSERDEFDSDFEVQVCNRLRESGHKVDTQVGFSGYRIDLAVVHPNDDNRYVLGIECDGATFHSARSVRERDVMRQQFLEGNGWKIVRVWSRNWWRNPDKEIDRLEYAIRKYR